MSKVEDKKPEEKKEEVEKQLPYVPPYPTCPSNSG